MTYWQRHKNIIFIVGRVVGASGSFGSFGLVVLLGKVLLSYYSFCHSVENTVMSVCSTVYLWRMACLMMASSKSCMVTGWSSSSLFSSLISSGLFPLIFRRIDIMDASLARFNELVSRDFLPSSVFLNICYRSKLSVL